MIAVVQTGGKQYLVKENDKLKIEKITGVVGEKIILGTVLLTAAVTGENCCVGNPIVSGAKVEAEIIKQAKAKKIRVVKYKNKTRYRRAAGHRQYFTEIKINKIIQ